MVTKRSTQFDQNMSAGEMLRRLRMERGLRIEEVAHELRIPPHHLRSLERGALEVFSAELYARGAYEKYARYLGLERQDYYYAFLRSLSGSRDEARALQLHVPATWFQRMLTPYGVLFAALGLGVLAIGGYLSWQVQTFVRLPDLQVVEPAQGMVEAHQVIVRGVAEAEAEVTVNGESVLLDDGNRFEFVLPVRSGVNVLQVTATGASGRTRTVTRELLVSRV